MSGTSTRRGRLALMVAGIALAGSMLTGCATGTPDLNADTAAGLQDGVLTVTTAAADGDFAGAQAALDTVQADLTAASAAEGVTAARAAEIQAAIDLVAGDLAAAIESGVPAEAPVEPEAPAETEAPVETEAPAETPVETPAPAPAPDNGEEEADENEPDENEPDESGDEAPAPAPKTESPAEDKSETGACEKKGKCD
jgi:outer membrane biosynthesis protein TonB